MKKALTVSNEIVQAVNEGLGSHELDAFTEEIACIIHRHYPSDLSRGAVALGKLGGSAKSEAKKKASRENGKRGGRPKKHI